MPTFRRLAERRPTLVLLIGAFAIAVVSTAWLLFQSPNFFSGYDFMRMHFFYKTYYRDALRMGELPLWNPYVGLGRPFMADIETATLYPPSLLVLVFGVYGGVTALVVLHQAIAIFGGVRLGQTIGTSTGAGLLIGVGSALASPFSARLDVGIIEGYFSMCWLPVLLWLGASLQDRWNPRQAAGFSIAVALTILAGQPPLAYVEFFGLLVFLAFRQRWPSGRKQWRSYLRSFLGLTAAGIVGVGLACAQLLPFFELVTQGNRPLNSRGFAIANGMPAPSWLSLLVPTSRAFGPNWEYGMHCGLVPLFAALGGLLLWRDRNVRALLGLGLVGALLAAGDRAPFLRWATHLLPGAAALRIPSRYGILFATALLGTSAIALSRKPPRGVLTFILAGLTVGMVWIVWLEPYVLKGGPGGPAYYLMHLGALGMAALLVVLWHRRHRWPQQAWKLGCLLTFFCAANWFLAIRLQSPVYSSYGFRTDDSAVREAMRAQGLFTAGGAPPRVSFKSWDVRENSGMVQGFGSFDSYVAPSLSRTWGYLHAAAGVPLSDSDFIRMPEAIADRAPRLDAANIVADFEPGRGLVVRSNPDPRTYLVYDFEVVADWKAAELKMLQGNKFHARALVEAAAVPQLSPRPGDHAGAAEITAFDPENVAIRVKSDSPAILVLAEAWYPGWRVTVNGSPAEIFPVNAWMRGVVIPAGSSAVLFTFRSRLLGVGLWISLASAGLLSVIAILGPRSRCLRAEADETLDGFQTL